MSVASYMDEVSPLNAGLSLTLGIAYSWLHKACVMFDISFRPLLLTLLFVLFKRAVLAASISFQVGWYWGDLMTSLTNLFRFFHMPFINHKL